MLNYFLRFPFIKILLPQHLLPIEDRYIGDEASIALIGAAEQCIQSVIDRMDSEIIVKGTFRHKEKQHVIKLKVTKQKIKLFLYDTKHSSAVVKKRMELICYRKHIKAVHGIGKISQAAVHYIHQGEVFVRSIKKSPYIQPLLYKIDMLDDALLGQFLDQSKKLELTNQFAAKHQEVDMLIKDINRITKRPNSISIEPVLQKRLHRVLEQAKTVIHHYHLLEIEDKYMIKRMLRSDLPKLLFSFTSLTPKNQLEQKERIVVALAKMELSLLSLAEETEKTKVSQLEHILKVTDRRYSSTNDKR